MPKGVKGFQPGVVTNPDGRPVGSKNKTTLLREERRAVFDERVTEKYFELIDAAKPEYLLDQFLGKAPDRLEAVHLNIQAHTIAPEVLAIAEEELKLRKLND